MILKLQHAPEKSGFNVPIPSKLEIRTLRQWYLKSWTTWLYYQGIQYSNWICDQPQVFWWIQTPLFPSFINLFYMIHFNRGLYTPSSTRDNHWEAGTLFNVLRWWSGNMFHLKPMPEPTQPWAQSSQGISSWRPFNYKFSTKEDSRPLEKIPMILNNNDKPLVTISFRNV